MIQVRLRHGIHSQDLEKSKYYLFERRFILNLLFYRLSQKLVKEQNNWRIYAKIPHLLYFSFIFEQNQSLFIMVKLLTIPVTELNYRYIKGTEKLDISDTFHISYPSPISQALQIVRKMKAVRMVNILKKESQDLGVKHVNRILCQHKKDLQNASPFLVPKVGIEPTHPRISRFIGTRQLVL